MAATTRSDESPAATRRTAPTSGPLCPTPLGDAAAADYFGLAEEVIAQETLVSPLLVGFGSQPSEPHRRQHGEIQSHTSIRQGPLDRRKRVPGASQHHQDGEQRRLTSSVFSGRSRQALARIAAGEVIRSVRHG